MRKNLFGNGNVAGEQLTEAERHVLVHTLTGGTGRVYRNHFVADDGHSDMPTLQSLTSKGLMVRRASELFHATAAGAAAVGLRLEEQSK